MKSEIKQLVAGAAMAAATLAGTTCHADNPIIQTKFADPAPKAVRLDQCHESPFILLPTNKQTYEN